MIAIDQWNGGQTKKREARVLMVPITRSMSLLVFLHFSSVCSVDLEVLTPLVIVDKSDLLL